MQKVADMSNGLLEDNNVQMNFIDIGARNGVLQLADLAKHIDAYGFEPNPEEYEKLVKGETDAAKYGIVEPPYRSLQYYHYAVSNQVGKTPFYVTPGPGAAGVLEPDLDGLSEIVTQGAVQYEESFGKEVFEDYEVVEVDTITLDAFCKEHDFKHIDYLKVDVEGFEYEVLQGALESLPITGVVGIETYFMPFRKNQKLFSHVDLVLREQGFELINFEIGPEQMGYKVLKAPVHYNPPFYADPHGRPMLCDAIYVNRNTDQAARMIAQAVILLNKKCIDEALFILGKVGIDQNIIETLKNTDLYFTTGERLRHRGYRFVDRLIDRLGVLKRGVTGG